jgi:hypothetical protein
MWRALLLLYFFVAGAVAALLGGFLTAVLLTLFTLGPFALFTFGPAIGGAGAFAGFKLALLPAILFGGLLWSLEIEEPVLWGATGAVVALILQAMIGAMVGGPGWLELSGAFMLAGIAAALVFRGIMVALTSFNQTSGRD